MYRCRIRSTCGFSKWHWNSSRIPGWTFRQKILLSSLRDFLESVHKVTFLVFFNQHKNVQKYQMFSQWSVSYTSGQIFQKMYMSTWSFYNFNYRSFTGRLVIMDFFWIYNTALFGQRAFENMWADFTWSIETVVLQLFVSMLKVLSVRLKTL